MDSVQKLSLYILQEVNQDLTKERQENKPVEKKTIDDYWS